MKIAGMKYTREWNPLLIGRSEWKRKWKLELIETTNPNWQDLYNTIVWLDSGFRRNDGGELDSG